MLRIVLLNILLFSLPFIAYAGYVLLTKNANNLSAWDDIPVVWLIGAGFALLIIGMVTLVSFDSGSPGTTYHPPVYHDGKIQPGYLD
ncbi:hypothetical protein A7A08_02278 [Methyloligella halotolerans]|uniref:Uncharacterized protein n=1 Tax=Methyloligella halotolerans TaxID=1177755 RepID=A0A1E2RXN1_9HYPH|nr:DUF6111 family protein [Methyloligella halotolerans]ODA66981.1 hypothetical protein A7A08_02278 [Methyloligella halotolerans]